MSFRSSVSLLILCLDDLSIVESGILKSIPFYYIAICFSLRSINIHLGAPMLDA